MTATDPAHCTVTPHTNGQLRVLTVGDVALYIDAYRLTVAGTAVRVPLKEFLLLRCLMLNAGRVVGRQELLDSAWDSADQGTCRNYLEVHIRRLRGKLGDYGVIRTVRGVGYCFDLPGEVI